MLYNFTINLLPGSGKVNLVSLGKLDGGGILDAIP